MWSIRFTWSNWMARALAREQSLNHLEERHILGGIYIACWETLIGFWGVPSQFEELVAQHCMLLRPRCAYHYMVRRNEVWEFTPRCLLIYNDAVELAGGRVRGPEESKILVTPEDFLLAFSQQDGLELGEKIRASTLDMKKLERAVISQRP
jgi:hypothetical protein